MPRGIVAILAGYAACVVFSLWDVVDGLILPHLPWWISLLAFFGAPGLGAVILLWALVRPKSWERWRIAIPAVLLGVLILWLVPPPLYRWGISRFVQRRDLNEYAVRVHAYRQITSLWEENGAIWALNGTRIAHTAAERDSARRWYDRDDMLLPDVLARDSVDPRVAEELLRGLQRFRFQRLSRNGDFVLFARGRDFGLVYAGQGAPPLAVGGSLPRTGVRITARMGRWYEYVCCVHEATVGPPDTVAADTGTRSARPE